MYLISSINDTKCRCRKNKKINGIFRQCNRNIFKNNYCKMHNNSKIKYNINDKILQKYKKKKLNIVFLKIKNDFINYLKGDDFIKKNEYINNTDFLTYKEINEINDKYIYRLWTPIQYRHGKRYFGQFSREKKMIIYNFQKIH